MLHLLASMKDWTAQDWGVWAAVCVLPILASVKAILDSRQAKQAAKEAQGAATDAKQTSAVAKAVTDVNTARISNVSNQQAATAGRVTDLAAAMPPVTITNVNAPPAPSPEAIERGLKDQ